MTTQSQNCGTSRDGCCQGTVLQTSRDRWLPRRQGLWEELFPVPSASRGQGEVRYRKYIRGLNLTAVKLKNFQVTKLPL
jgi:hypothetical protein